MIVDYLMDNDFEYFISVVNSMSFLKEKFGYF